MENKEFELRMYFLVMYNISEIQKGIQAGHAALEYAHRYKDDSEYIRFVENYKTWIILNGGTSNEKGNTIYSDEFIGFGSMEEYDLELVHSDINHSVFVEPDLNNSLSAICFLADERVFNKKDYPDLYEYYIHNFSGTLDNTAMNDEIDISITNRNAREIIPERFPKFYEKWVNNVGGLKNVFLREFLRTKRLA